MGNRPSSINKKKKGTVYEILEIEENATREEIKKQYHRMLLRNHPDLNKNGSNEKVIQIKEAYKKIEANEFKIVIEKEKKVNIFDIKKYNKNFWNSLNETEFYKEANALFDIIIENENVYEKRHMPKFGDSDAKNIAAFYYFYSVFKTNIKFTSNYNFASAKDKKYYDKTYDKDEKRKYNDGVRSLSKIIQLVDPRLKRKVVHEAPVYKKEDKKPEKIKKPKVKKSTDQYLFYCDACSKGFMSVNTMQTHLKSNKHKLKLLEMNMEDINIDEILSQKNVQVTKENTEDKIELSEDSNILLGENDTEEITENTEEESVSLEKEFENLDLNKKCKKKLNKKDKKPRRAIKKKPQDKSRDTEMQLTCSFCKEIFDSRNKLFDHLRTNHK